MSDLRELSGLFACVSISGTVRPEFSQSLLHAALHNAQNGFVKVEYRVFDAKLVERGRDAVCQHALNEGYDWLLMADADATFPKDALPRMLNTAFTEQPEIDVLGGYSTLKQHPFLPTIDTGTGTWEEHYPGEGVLPAIRTGGHFVLVKTPILRRFGPPWWRTRRSVPPARALAEVDNFARMRLDGENPLAKTSEWQTMVAEAKKGDEGTGQVGEDSGFMDAVKAVGGNIAVDTNLVTGHVTRRTVSWQQHKEAMEKQRQAARQAVGILE